MTERKEVVYDETKIEALKESLLAKQKDNPPYFALAEVIFNYCESGYYNRDENKRNVVEALNQAYGAPFFSITSVETVLNGPLKDALILLFGEEKGAELVGLLQRRMDYPYESSHYYRKGFRSSNCAHYFSAYLEMISDYLDYQGYDFSYMDYLTSTEFKLNNDNLMADLLAREIDNSNEQVIEALKEIMFGENQSAWLTREMIRAIVQSHHVGCYEMLAKLLIAAQQQEGLRQQIVESADEGTVEASIFLAKTVLEHKLERFSAVARAFDTWSGLNYTVVETKPAKFRQFIEMMLRSLEDPAFADEAKQGNDALQYYFYLWAAAVKDASKLPQLFDEVVNEDKRYKKLTALYFMTHLNETNIQHQLAVKFLPQAVAQNDTELLAWTVRNLYENYNLRHTYRWDSPELNWDETNKLLLADEVGRNEQFQLLLDALKLLKGQEETFAESVFPWCSITLDTAMLTVRLMTIAAYDFSADKIDLLMQQFNKMSSDQRQSFIFYFIRRQDNEQQRSFLMTCLSDRSVTNREFALHILDELELTEEEINKLMALLKQKTGSVRQAAVKLLLKLNDARLVATTSKLLSVSNVEQRLAGLELVNQLKQDNERQELGQKLMIEVEKLQGSGKATSPEEILISGLLSKKQKYNAEIGFGLYNPDVQVEVPSQYEHPGKPLPLTDAVKSVLFGGEKSCQQIMDHFQKLVLNHHDHEYETVDYNGKRHSVLLGNAEYRFEQLYKEGNDQNQQRKSFDELTLDNFPLADVWRQAALDLKLSVNDMLHILFVTHGMEYVFERRDEWFKELYGDIIEKLSPMEDDYKYYRPILNQIRLLLNEADQSSTYRLSMDAFLYLQSRMTEEQCKQSSVTSNGGYYYYGQNDATINSNLFTFWVTQARGAIKEDSEFREFFYVSYAVCRMLNNEYQFGIGLEDITKACRLGLLSDEQLIKEMFIGAFSDSLIRRLNHPKWGEDAVAQYPQVQDLLEDVIDRIVEIESQRGDMPTEVTKQASQIQRVEGIQHFTQLLIGLGKDTFQRGYSYGGNYESKRTALSSLLHISFPAKGDDAQKLKELLAGTDVTEQRLIDAAMYAPQWVTIIEQNLNWPGLKRGIWYFQAHISDYFSAQKETEVAIYSPISPSSFSDGAFDSDWFNKAYQELGKKRFDALYAAAKYISEGGASHRRAQLFADAVTGKLKKRQLASEIRQSRNKDKLLSYALIPIKDHKKDTLERYEFIQKFLLESKQFGAQRRESEAKVCAIALENLARNSGYSDVNRMMWSLEADKLEQLQPYFEPQEYDGAKLWLTIEEEGAVELHIEKNGKELKSIPASHKKNKFVLEMKDVQKSLKEQYARARRSFEQAMEEHIPFAVQELINITRNQMVTPLIQSLVWCNEDTSQIGYLHQDDASEQTSGAHADANADTSADTNKASFSLRSADGSLTLLEEDTALYLAHPVQLYKSGQWSAFQKDLFERQIKQPFKQVFREYYRLDQDELKAETESARYAGHQIQPQRTVALLRGRKWTVDYEEGLQKVYYKENLIAKMYAMADWFSPADIEPPTLESVRFLDRTTFKPVKLQDVPEIIFSEVMRDIDLVVSTAHAGGVDPEASHSTVEMRTAIATELLALLKVENVIIEGNHAHIKGSMGEYSVHMGSGVAHKKGVGALNIIPIHSQSRGRLFLPFADSDPRTAEIMAKILLLAEDQKIKDPSILAKM